MSDILYVPKVAVIGTEGSGKTVLVVTLAARFCDGHGRYFLEPKNRSTVRYMRSAFGILNGEKGPTQWLPSTDPGTMCELEWDLHVDGKRQFAMRMVDAAGQDFRDLFGEERAISAAGVTPLQQQLVEFVRQADILLLTVDLEDFVAETDSDRRDTNEWTLKFAIDHLIGEDKRKRGVLVFTGKDRYRQYEQELGSWAAVAKRYLPVASRAAIDNGQVSVLAVSAVNETQLDPAGANRYVPKPGFSSVGLEQLLDWITTQGSQVRDEVAQSEEEEEAEVIASQDRARAEVKKHRWTRWWEKMLPKVFGTFAVSWFLWRQIFLVLGLFCAWRQEPVHKDIRVTKGVWPFQYVVTDKQLLGHRDINLGLAGFGEIVAVMLAAGGAAVVNKTLTD